MGRLASLNIVDGRLGIEDGWDGESSPLSQLPKTSSTSMNAVRDSVITMQLVCSLTDETWVRRTWDILDFLECSTKFLVAFPAFETISGQAVDETTRTMRSAAEVSFPVLRPKRCVSWIHSSEEATINLCLVVASSSW